MSKHRKNSRRKKYINRTLIKFVKVLFLLFEIIGFPKQFSRFSNRIFNNWQLFALLVIRAKTKQSPEDLVEQFLPGNGGLLNALALTRIPTASALRKFARRLKARWEHTALAGCAALAGLNDLCSGIDGTGHSKLKGSKHYYRRTGKRAKKKDFVKVVGLDDLTTHLVIGDKGFDAQKNHDIVHKHGALLITPIKNQDVPVWRTKGEDRKKLKRYFPLHGNTTEEARKKLFGVLLSKKWEML